MSLCFDARQKHLIHPDFVSSAIDRCFDLDYLQNHITDTPTGGRGEAWFFAHDGGDYILRHYRRGGALAKFLSDKFIYLGAKRTRSFREFAIHRALFDAGLPVAKPVGAQITVHGLWYRADYISEKIPNAQTLCEFLRTNSKPNTAIWQMLTTTVAQFHQFGLNHCDLNCHNILLASGQMYLIDFDKCTLDGNAHTVAQNKARLRRSLQKEFPEVSIPDF